METFCAVKCSVVATASPAMLAGEVDVRMYDAHVAGEGIVAREGLFLLAERAPHFLLADVVDGVFMSSQVVRA